MLIKGVLKISKEIMYKQCINIHPEFEGVKTLCLSIFFIAKMKVGKKEKNRKEEKI